MSEDDLEKIVEELLRAKCVIIPDIPSERPEVQRIESLKTFREFRALMVRLFFAVSDDWGIAPFEWGRIEKDGKANFFIRQKAGGPTLDVFAPFRLVDSNDKIVLPHGFIGYHSTFWNPLSQRIEKPPTALKAMYRGLVETLRVEGEQIQARHRRYLVAKGAKDKVATGYMLGAPFDR